MSREFNFDELDKAVNSLIGDPAKQPAQPAASTTPAATSQPQAAQPAPPQTSLPPASVPPRANSTPVPSRNIPTAERSAPTASSQPTPAPVAPTSVPTPAKPAVEKPGAPGRFMDVVHPASDMAVSAKEEMKKGIGAEGKTVEPLSSNITPDPLPEKSAANTPNSAQLSVKAPVTPDAMITTPDTEEKAWEDPLEEATKNEKEREIKQGAQERLGLTPKANEQDQEKSEEKKPLFLPDAKVEKRPLGAFAEDNKAEEKETKEDDKDKKETPAKLTIDGVGDVDSEEKKAEEESSDLLLPELGKEIVAVEASDTIAGDEDSAKKDEEKEKSKEQDKKKEDDKDKKAPAKPDTFSIPKQYKEKQASADHKPKSIYDTEEYHRSLATAAAKKKKNNKWWVWVLVILGLLILGVGLGAGAYFLVGI